MNEVYECSRCGVVAETNEQLCSPEPLGGKQDYCGTAPERGTMCDTIQEQLPYVCGTCGRPAEQSDLVCDPQILG